MALEILGKVPVDKIEDIRTMMESVYDDLASGHNKRPVIRQPFRKSNEVEGFALTIYLTLRQFRMASTAVYLGLIIIWEFIQGFTDTFENVFADVADSLAERRAKQSGKYVSVEEYMTLQNQIIELQNRMLSAPQQPVAIPSQVALDRSITPRNDDDFLDIEVKKADLGDENPTFNMLISVAQIDGTGYLGLGLEVLEYGVKKGKIPEHILGQKKKLITEKNGETQPTMAITVEEKIGGPKPMAGANLAFSVPDFDDDDVDIEL